MQNFVSNSANIIQEYKSKINDTYKNYLSGDELKVTLFKIDKEHTVFADSSETVYEKIGSDSGIRFKKINDYILFNCLETTVETAWSFETGYRAEDILFEAIAIPTVVQPSVGDYIQFLYSDSLLTLEVQPESSESSIEKNFFKKLKMKVVRYTKDDLLDQTVEELNFIASRDLLVSNSFKSVLLTVKDNIRSSLANMLENEYSLSTRSFSSKTRDENILIRDGLSKLLLSITDKRTFQNIESLYSIFLQNDINTLLAINKDYYSTYYPEYVLSDTNVYNRLQINLFRFIKLIEIDAVIENKNLSIADKIANINAKKLSFNNVRNNNNLIFSMNTILNKNIDLVEDINFSNFLDNLVIDNTTMTTINNKSLFCINSFINTVNSMAEYNNSLIVALKMTGKLIPNYLSDDLLITLLNSSTTLNNEDNLIINPEQLLTFLSIYQFVNLVDEFKIRYYNNKFIIGGI